MSAKEPTPLEAALAKVVDAVAEYNKLAPPPKVRTDPPNIKPTLLHAEASSFYLGYNIACWAGGHMPGKVPVVVVPARPEDLRNYARYRSAKSLRKRLLLLP